MVPLRAALAPGKVWSPSTGHWHCAGRSMPLQNLPQSPGGPISLVIAKGLEREFALVVLVRLLAAAQGVGLASAALAAAEAVAAAAAVAAAVLWLLRPVVIPAWRRRRSNRPRATIAAGRGRASKQTADPK